MFHGVTKKLWDLKGDIEVIKIEKNIYDPPSSKDGKRILVMRIWPRGVKKTSIDDWIKELGTEVELIKAWKDNKISWAELKKAYIKSIKGKKELIKQLAVESKKKTISLLCSCKDPERCHRSLLKSAIESYQKKYL